MKLNAESGQVISSGITDWLRQEIVAADSGRNQYLSEFELRKADLFKSFDDPTNLLAQKHWSHFNRLKLWLLAPGEDLVSNDWFAARLLYACMMGISGSYRKQLYLQSPTTAEYDRSRHSSPIGINVNEVVDYEFQANPSLVADDLGEQDKITYLTNRTLEVNERSFSRHGFTHTWVREHELLPDFAATDNDEAVVAMFESQRVWTGLAVAHIMVAASFRDGDLSRVPMLEPKSISDVSENVIFPFQAPN